MEETAVPVAPAPNAQTPARTDANVEELDALAQSNAVHLVNAAPMESAQCALMPARTNAAVAKDAPAAAREVTAAPTVDVLSAAHLARMAASAEPSASASLTAVMVAAARTRSAPHAQMPARTAANASETVHAPSERASSELPKRTEMASSLLPII